MGKTVLNIRQLNAIGSNGIATDAEVAQAILDHKVDINPHTQYLSINTDRGIPGGYAPLDSTGLLPITMIPATAVINILQTANVDGGSY